MDTVFRLRFLGPIQVERDGTPVGGFRSRKALALLAYLAAQDRPVPRDHLAGLFWEDKPEAEGRANLSWVLNKLGQLLPGCWQADRHTVQFIRTRSCWLDVDAFESLAAQREAAALAEAVQLYRGEFLEGMELDGCAEFGLWLVGERERWRQCTVGALDELVAHHNRRGAHAAQLLYGRRLLLLEPWREETHRQLMRLLARSGQRSAALAQYEDCRQTLANELAVEPMRETTALYERIRTADAARRHNLPAQPTRFIGREAELARVIGLLDQPDCRLLTLVGPGGIGKTRLALQAAAARLDAFLEGAYFVPLAGTGVEFLGSAIAGALGFSFFGSQDPRAQLVNYLRGKEVLLILDSMEHLLDGTALLVDLLQQAPEVKLLVTSRERLNLRWEWCVHLDGLAYPASRDEAALQSRVQPKPDDGAAPLLDDYAAMQLFGHVARQVGESFAPAAHERVAIARICRLVEGMPLGIELAATWVGTRTCEEIAAEIERGLGVLTTSLRDVPERHRSIRATFEYSWQLLDPASQRVLVELAVFQRGFRQEPAAQVAAACPAVLQSLVDQSLLRQVPPDRYEMHELLRQYAAEKLAQRPQAQADARDRHCAYYAAFMQAQEAGLAGPRAADAIAAIQAEIDNVRVAWRWATEGARLPEIERALKSLALFYTLTGPYQEGEAAIALAVERVRALTDQADQPSIKRASALAGQADPPMVVQELLSRLLAEQARFLNARGLCKQAATTAEEAVERGGNVDPAGRATVLQASGYLQWGQALWGLRDYEAARAKVAQALSLAQAARAQQVEAGCLNQLGLVCWHLSDYAGAGAYFDQALRVFREIGDWKGESGVLISVGNVCGYQGRYADARAYFERALCLFRQASDHKGESVALVNLGLVGNLQGDFADAMTRYGQGLRIARELGDRPAEALAVINLGYLSDQSGGYADAASYYQQASRIYREIGDRQGESLALACLGLLAHHQGDDVAACEHGQRSLQMAREIGNRHVQGYALTRLGHALVRLGRLAEAAETYREAYSLRLALAQSNLAMESLAGLARVSLAQGDIQQARAHVGEILRHLESHIEGDATSTGSSNGLAGGLAGVDEPGRICLTCYQVLSAAQDPRAGTILNAARRLLDDQTARIGDAEGGEALKRSFVENVAAHREIMRMPFATR